MSPPQTCVFISMQCFASIRIGKSFPSSLANELSGASVPDESTTERAPFSPVSSENANAGLSAEKFTLTISLTGKRVSVDFERCVVAALSSSIVLVKKIR